MKSKLLGEKWHECDRCGEQLPESKLIYVKSKGLWLCEKCYDDNEEE